MTNLYAVLNVSPQATLDQIKSAYRRLARAYHPDLQGNDPGHNARFQQIQAAYEVLKDSAQRKAYDEKHHLEMAQQAAGRGSNSFAEQFETLWNEVGEEMAALAADGVRAGFACLRQRYGMARWRKPHSSRTSK